MERIVKIVLTGGPCAGKTTALSKIVDKFSAIGFSVIVVPESATLFMSAGVNFNVNRHAFYNTEKVLFNFQVEIENTFEKIANSSDLPTLIIYDRGLMDIAAYLTNDMWQSLIDESGYNKIQIRDKRYDGVIHMVTAAKGAEKYYTLENNIARTETISDARLLDDKLIEAWTGHPHLRIIPNEGSFDDKINAVLSAISCLLGIPTPIETERKFIVELKGEIPTFSEVEIFQTYLVSPDGIEQRVRKRGQNNNFIYFFTQKQFFSKDSRIETERQITPAEYLFLLEKADKNKQIIHKLRKCIIYDNKYFELDTFISPKLNVLLLELEGVQREDKINFPPFIEVIKEVTDDKTFYNSSIALIKNIDK
jgi:CYTH domain-containing protein/predicted ATPase